MHSTTNKLANVKTSAILKYINTQHSSSCDSSYEHSLRASQRVFKARKRAQMAQSYDKIMPQHKTKMLINIDRVFSVSYKCVVNNVSCFTHIED